MTIDAALAADRGPASPLASQAMAEVEAHTAHNYHPLPVVLARGEGAWVEDVDGNRYLDLLAGYSALNFGHRNPRLVAAAERQLGRLTLTSRAFHNDLLGVFARELAGLCGMDAVLPMNTGAEAVETAIKLARKWGYERKGVADDRARLVVMGGNFHGRTTTIVGFSDDPGARAGFGPFTPGFVRVEYGDAAALAAVINDETVGVLLEPIQGEGGVIIPPDGYLREVRRLCTERNVLMLADEIQSGLGRTGRTFACDHEDVVPDVYILGKALGGGILPVSAVVARAEVMDVIRPGEHGSTFGGNPLACAVGIEVVRMLATGEPQGRAAELGDLLARELATLPVDKVSAVRVRGLWAGIDLIGRTGRDLCEGLLRRGVLAKDTHGSTIRLAPPIVIEREDLVWAMGQLRDELAG
jgi:ornithine--oxo-acid transaminase